MSMHDVEAYIEAAVRLIDESGLPGQRKRDLIYSLFQMQELADTGFTHMRTTRAMVRSGYTFLFDKEQMPDYAEHREFYDITLPEKGAFRNGDIYIFKDADNDFPEAADKICVDSGSAMWRKMVETGILTGKDAVQVARIPDKDVFQATVPLIYEKGWDDDYLTGGYCMLFSLCGLWKDTPAEQYPELLRISREDYCRIVYWPSLYGDEYLEEAIRAVAAADIPAAHKRDFVFSLKQMEQYGTGHVYNVRVLEELLQCRYTFRFDAKDMYDYEDNKAAYYEQAFARIDTNRKSGGQLPYTFSVRAPEELVRVPGKFYVDRGTEGWRGMVAAGKLLGEDALPPSPLPPEDVLRDTLLWLRSNPDSMNTGAEYGALWIYWLSGLARRVPVEKTADVLGMDWQSMYDTLFGMEE